MDRFLIFISSPCQSDSNPVGHIPGVGGEGVEYEAG